MWSTIKDLLQKTRKGCIIVEGEQPKYIIIPLEEYERLIKYSSFQDNTEKNFEKINKEIETWRAEVNNKINNEEPVIEPIENTKEKKITIEDIPF